jgi:hypothetical protein
MISISIPAMVFDISTAVFALTGLVFETNAIAVNA